MSVNSNQIAEVKEYWFKNFGTNIGFGLKVSAAGGIRRIIESEPPEPEEPSKIISVIHEQESLRKSQRPLRSVIVDKSDLLPSSFLEIGAKLSLAVCRISRNFSLQEFKALLEEENIDNSLKKKELQEIFLIPDQIIDDIFKDELRAVEKLRKINENQLAKINPIPIGTGFLVGGTHLLTNNHVIPNLEIARQCIAQFNYVRGEQNYTTSIDYEFAPEIFFVTEPNLDYTLVQLKSGMFTRQSGYRFGWIQLIENDENVSPGIRYLPLGNITEIRDNSVKEKIEQLKKKEYIIRLDKLFGGTALTIWHSKYKDEQIEVELQELQRLIQEERGREKQGIISIYKNDGDYIVIIQHPKGKQKQIVLSDNKILNNGLYKNFLRYKADSDYGSSGSPAFNFQWELVALHHAAVAKEVEQQQNGKKQQQQSNGKTVEIDAQQGVRICRIIEDLKKKSSNNPKLQSFIEDFVVTSEQMNFPPLPSALEFDGESSYVDLGAHESLDVTKEITVEIWVQRNPTSGDGIIINRDKAFSVHREKGKITVTLQKDGQSKTFSTKESVLNDGLWHHIAFTSNSNDLKIYIDGDNEEIQPPGNRNFPGDIGKSEKSLYIGHNDEKQNPKYFSGSIAEVRLWGIARSQSQIEANMYRRLSSDDRKELRGYWRFEESEGYKVHNLAKSNISNLPSFVPFILDSQQPQFGLQLNGRSDYIDCGNYESLKIEEAITIEAWVKSNNDQDGIIVNRGGSLKEVGYSFYRYNKIICLELEEITYFVTNNEVINDNLWHHVAFTWDRNSGKVEIYIDGERQNLSPKSEFFQEPDKPSVNLNIGRAQNYGDHFNGSIAEVRLWKIVRSQDQIKANMVRQLEDNEKEGLVGYWRLDEEEGDRAENLVSKSDVGVVYGGKWLKPYSLLAADQGAFGVAFKTKRLKASQYPGLPLPFGLKFNESGDRVDCGSSESLNTPEAITVEAWVKHKFGNCLIVSRGGTVKKYDGSVEKGYSLSWNDGKIRVALRDDTSEKTIVYSKENAPVDRVWHHIAFTWEKSSQEIAIYIDGRRQDSVVEGKSNAIVFEGQNKSIGLFAGSIDNPVAHLLIGIKDEEETNYNVAIAEVRLWKVARTQDQIKANMSMRLDVEKEKNEGLIGYWRLDDGGESNNLARNLVFDAHHGTIHGAKWFPAPPEKLSEL